MKAGISNSSSICGERARRIVTILGAIILIFSISASATSAIPAVPPWHGSNPWTTETARVLIGEEEIVAEIADTRPLQTRGLGSRDSLEPGTGMIFVFETPGVRTFWMKGMRFCIDIVWIADEKVIGYENGVCPSPGVNDADLPRFSSQDTVDFVLEVPAGWMDEHDFDSGTPVKVEFP